MGGVLRLNGCEEYEKPGKYGDEKTEKFAFVPDEQPDWAELVASLAAGDRVKIAWLHANMSLAKSRAKATTKAKPSRANTRSGS